MMEDSTKAGPKGEPNATASTGSAKPDPSKIKETLARLKLQREQTGGSETPSSKPTTNQSMNSESMRKQLQSWRAKTRESGDFTNDSGNARASGRQGPRSPLKSAMSSRKGTTRFNFDMSEVDDGGHEESGDIGPAPADEDEDEEYVPILTINPAVQTFPLSIAPKSRSMENKLQSVVLVPAPYVATSDVANALRKCQRATGHFCSCISCCPAAHVPEAQDHAVVRHERDFLNTKDNFELFRWVDGQKVTSADLQDLHEVMGAATRGGAISPTKGMSAKTARMDDDDACDESDSLFDGKAARVDGIYNDNPPLLARVLLDAEHVPASIAQLSAANLQLSRATQRILRDLIGGIQARHVRKKWREMTRRPGQSGPDKGGQSPLTPLSPAPQSSQLQRPDVPGEVHLLQQLNTAPVLQIIENPVAGGSSQPLVPKPSLGLGGQLGQWGAEGTLADKFGPLPVGWSGRRGGQRAKFKLHLHQLLLTDHPLMSAEERQLVQLKAIYAQYRSLFEQKVLEFLTQRLFALIEELQRMMRLSEERDLDEEETLALRGIYKDLVETLPALNKLNEAVDSLSSSVYEGWREIQESRLRSGIVRTAAELVVRRVKSNLVAPVDSHSATAARLRRRAAEEQPLIDTDDGADDQGAGAGASPGGSGEFWEAFKKSLQAAPQLLRRAQDILFKQGAGIEDGDQSPGPGTGPQERSAPNTARPLETARSVAGSQVAIVANEQQRAKQAQLNRVIKVVSSAVERLVENGGVIPKYAMRLSETGHVTPENQLTAAELKRRAVLRNLRIKAVVKINGKEVTSSLHHALKPATLSVDFNRCFEFRVLHQPMAVTVDLYTSEAGSWSSSGIYLATVSVPFPAQSSVRPGAGSRTRAAAGAAGGALSSGDGGRYQHVTHSYTPTSGWYSFASQLVEGAADRRIEGSILCTAEYDVSAQEGSGGFDGVRPEDVALVPAAKPTLKSVTGGALGKAHDFTRENDFQVLLPEVEEIDVNDPDNDHLLYLKAKRLAGDDSDVFRLSGYDFGAVFYGEEGHPFSNYVKYKETPRMKLLQLRCVKPYLFNAPIPLNEEQIKRSELYKAIFQNELHEKMARMRGDKDDYPMEDKLASGTVSVNTAKVTSFLQRVRNSQTAMSRKKKKKNFVTSSVVVETDYVTLQELEFFDLLERKRSLRPKVKVRAPLSVQVDRCELLVQVVGAKNVPLRSEFDGMAALAATGAGAGAAGSGGGAGAGLGGGDGAFSASAGSRRPRSSSGAALAGDAEAPIVSEHMLDERKLKEKRRARSFVEIKFQENTIATVAMDGGTPMWRESLSLPFRPPQDDFTPASLEQVREEVYFTLFDEVVEDDSGRGGFLEGESTIRVEKRYLGSFSIPFQTIYKEGRVEGVFRIDTPAINFGYDHAASAVTARRRENTSMFVGAETEEERRVAQQRAAEAEAGTVWGTFMRLLECLSQTHSQLTVKHPDDSLYYSGSHLHQATQSEFSYFAAGDSATFLKVFITLDPVLTCTPTVTEDITLGNLLHDDRAIGAYARAWLKGIQSLGPHTRERKYRLFGTNSEGYNVFIPRYLTAQAPPRGYESRRACVHLVSTIPFMNDIQSFIGEMDLWCTTTQFWEVGAGDEEEHAVTLFNYLYYLSLRGGTVASAVPAVSPSSSSGASAEGLRESVFLVMGSAVPEGDSVYVMIRDHKRTSAHTWGPESFLFINPWTGYVYSGVDPNCPLRSVHLLATPSNMWANIQTTARPCEMSFDLGNFNSWRPFFGSRFPLPKGGLNTVQTEIDYLETSPGYALEIERSVFQTIRNRIRKWRSKRQRSTTTFHPDACAVIHDILPKLENWKRCGNPDAYEEASGKAALPADQSGALTELQRLAHDKMKTLLRTRTLRGFPLNMPFTDVEEILTKVKTMCVHEAQHPEVQFVMAVRAFPMYNNILSLWVFLGTLEPSGI